MKRTLARFPLLGLAFVIVLTVVLLPADVWADDTYPIESGIVIDDPVWGATRPQGTDGNKLVRLYNGRLYHIGHYKYGAAQEIYLSYSDDNSLNWTNVKLTNVGHEQMRPAIGVSSNWDLHMAWCGRGFGAHPTSFGLIYMHYDYSTDTFSSATEIWDSTENLAYEGVGDIDIVVDGNDDLHICFAEGKSNLLTDTYYMNASYNEATETWGTWSEAERLAEGTDGDARGVLSAAVDKDNYLGLIETSSCSPRFWLRNPSTETWASETITDASCSDFCPSLMASISGGDTIWHALFTDYDAGNGWLLYQYRQSGVWSAQTILISTGLCGPFMGTALAQGHGSGDGDTGTIWAFGYSAASGGTPEYIKVRSKVPGGSWASTQTISTDGKHACLSGTKELYPYIEESDWHWNMAANAGILTYAGSTDATWGSSANDYYEYFLDGSDWGTFPPIVETDDPTDVTKTTALFNGEILADGGATITTRGFEYGLTQTATWTVSESGSYDTGTYSLTASDLESDTIYYVRAYADNSEGRGYGDWIGFITSQPSYTGDVDAGGDGYIPPLPAEPGGWIRPPKDWGTIGIGDAQIPFTFLVFLLLVAFVFMVGIAITKHTRHLGLLWLVLGLIIAWFCFWPREGYLDWWVLLPYILVGWALIVKEQQWGW